MSVPCWWDDMTKTVKQFFGLGLTLTFYSVPCVHKHRWTHLLYYSVDKHTAMFSALSWLCFFERTKQSYGVPAHQDSGATAFAKIPKWSFYKQLFLSPVLDYHLLNFSLLFVCVCVCVYMCVSVCVWAYVCVCDFCSEEGKSSPLVDGSKWSSACQQRIIGICKGQQALKSHPTLFVSSILSLPSLSPLHLFWSFMLLSYKVINQMHMRKTAQIFHCVIWNRHLQPWILSCWGWYLEKTLKRYPLKSTQYTTDCVSVVYCAERGERTK